MPKLPVLSGKYVIKILKKNGFTIIRQKGSHVSLQKIYIDGTFNVIVPMHDELAKGTLLSIIKQSGLTRKDFE